jgi:hypothetical protein
MPPQLIYTSLSAGSPGASSSLRSCGVSRDLLFPQESSCISTANLLILQVHFSKKRLSFEKLK